MKRIGTRRSNISNKERPSHWANDAGTAFKNPWPSATMPTWLDTLRKPLPIAQYDQHFSARAKAHDRKSVRPDWGVASLKRQNVDKSTPYIVGTWLGHACALAEIPPLPPSNDTSKSGTKSETQTARSTWILFDPIFSQRAGPTQYTGPGRILPPPCNVDDLPGCDAVLISHNHYDHLDFESIKSLLRKFPKVLFFVPLRNKDWMVASGVPEESVFELDWWQSLEFEAITNRTQSQLRQLDSTTDRSTSRLRLTCVPAQHNSGRGASDQGKTLWSGWIVERYESSKSGGKRKGAIYHAGDSGYRSFAGSTEVCPAFKDIGALGPFDLSFIPIWRGGTLGFFSYVGLKLSLHDVNSVTHGTPEDAACIHQDVKSRNSIAIHWGTFVGHENESYEAIVDFETACQKAGFDNLEKGEPSARGKAGIVDYGGSLAVVL